MISFTRRVLRGVYYCVQTLLVRVKVSEAVFLDVIGTEVLRVFLLDIHSHLY
jgi:hypothetical protein